MIGKSISAPSGTFKLEENGYSTRSMYVFEINKKDSLKQIYPYEGGSTIDIESHPFIDDTPSICVFGMQKEYYEYDSGILTIVYTLMGISILLIIGSLIFVIIERNKLIIRSFGRMYSFLLPFVLLFCSLSTIPMAIPPTKENDICMIRPLLLGLSVKMLFSLLFAKVTKFYMKSRKRKGIVIVKTKITMRRVLTYFLSFSLFGIILHLLWRYIQPNE